jgi:hypothetical protein
MMGELKRKEEQLTTADLARGSEADRNVGHEPEDPDRPKLVRSVAESKDRPVAMAPKDRPIAVESKGRPAMAQQERAHDGGGSTPLFSESDVTELRTRWSHVQTGFVDEPRRAVEEADKLVASVMKRLAEGFANERTTLEKQWDRGDHVSTEDLRVALQRYRSFFDRLLNA